jgi:ABC-2 type transport system ATP-binding protein
MLNPAIPVRDFTNPHPFSLCLQPLACFSMNAISAENLSKSFKGVTAVKGLNLTVAEGELFGLIGPDGAGKTTTMRMLTAIMDPTAGEAWVMGRHTVSEAEAIKEEIGYMSQRFGLYPDLTVMENIRFYADIYGVAKKGLAEKIDGLLAFSNLTPFKQRQAGKLSGGMKQKLGLACALVHTPRVLFLDEPTNGVDPVSRRDFWRILYQLLREGVTIFVTTAYLDEADRCHRVGLIHKGKLLACDTPDNLRRLMKGAILEVRTTDLRKSAKLLREGFPGFSVGLFGDRIHVVTDDPVKGERLVAELLQREGIALTGTREIEPSLEDVFVSVLSESNG